MPRTVLIRALCAAPPFATLVSRQVGSLRSEDCQCAVRAGEQCTAICSLYIGGLEGKPGNRCASFTHAYARLEYLLKI